jgi:hypothetical protein
MIEVKPRYDGKGTEFGLIHRELPGYLVMFDIDKMKSTINLDLNYENSLWIEGSPNFKNATMQFTAIFDLKYKETERLTDERITMKVGTSLWALRKMAEQLKCRLFLVYQTNGKQPFHFYQADNFGIEWIDRGWLEYNETNKKEKITEFWKKIGIIKP